MARARARQPRRGARPRALRARRWARRRRARCCCLRRGGTSLGLLEAGERRPTIDVVAAELGDPGRRHRRRAGSRRTPDAPRRAAADVPHDARATPSRPPTAAVARGARRGLRLRPPLADGLARSSRDRALRGARRPSRPRSPPSPSGPLVARIGLVADDVLVAQCRALRLVAGGRVVVALGTGDQLSREENLAYGVGVAAPDERRASLRAVAATLHGERSEVWIGDGAAATREVAADVGCTLNLWDRSPAEEVAGAPGGSAVSWAGPRRRATERSTRSHRRAAAGLAARGLDVGGLRAAGADRRAGPACAADDALGPPEPRAARRSTASICPASLGHRAPGRRRAARCSVDGARGRRANSVRRSSPPSMHAKHVWLRRRRAR